MQCMLKSIFVFLLFVFIASSSLAVSRKVCPVVDATDGILLGGSVDGRWSQDSEIAHLMKGGEKYKLYTLTKYIGESIGSKPEEEEIGGYGVDIDSVPKVSEHVIGISSKWNAMPRVPRVQSVIQKTYIEVVRRFLQGEGIRNPKVNVTQVIRVDLEGDGTDEVLISATVGRKGYGELPEVRATAGDYSVVLMRKLINGSVATLCLDSQIHSKPEIGKIPDKFYIPAILDFNGDGIMEVAVSWRYYEGHGVNVYSVKGRTVKPVIGGGWGV